MSVSSSAQTSELALDSGPDFLEFLRDDLNVADQDATALLGRWLLDYEPREKREIRVLCSSSGPAPVLGFSMGA